MRSIRKELEEINMGVALREGDEREEVDILLFICKRLPCIVHFGIRDKRGVERQDVDILFFF